jgi:trehalose 6-phosphate synthase
MGEAIARALTMPEEEQRQRMRRMREIVRDNNIYRWAGSMLQDAARLRKRSEIQEATTQSVPEPPHFPDNVVRMFDRPRAMARDKASMARRSTVPPAQ